MSRLVKSSLLVVLFLILLSFSAEALEQIVLTQERPDVTVPSGASVTVYGTQGANQVTINAGAYAELVNFPGINTITIESDSSNFTMSRSGAVVTFEGADQTVLKMPATNSIQIICFYDVSKELVIINNKVMLGLQEVSADSAAIRPIAGILELFINENNQVSGFPGESIDVKINIISDSQDNSFSFEIEDAHSEIAVSIEGRITYTIPEDSETEIFIPFKVKVLNIVSDESLTLEGVIYVMQTVEIGSGTVTSEGGTVSASSEDIFVEIPAGAVSQDVAIKIVQSQDASANYFIDITADGNIDGTFDVYLPDSDSFDSNRYSDRMRKFKNKLLGSSGSYPIKYSYITNSKKYFTKVYGWRLPDGTTKFTLTWEEKLLLFPILLQDAYALNSSKPEPANSGTLEGEALLFIHGYKPSVLGLGGGEETWGNFPLLIQNMNGDKTYIPFEFQWKTNAKFEDVADDLGKCLSTIASYMKTNKKIHIIAHSFGGIVTRTLVQKLNTSGYDYSALVASVTTLGTPHSGILDHIKTLDDVILPCGQDALSFEGARQISTYEMGEYNIDVSLLHKIFKIDKTEGKLPANLANTVNSLPDALPIQVGIGLTTDRDSEYIIDSGDKLITYEGQRFYPNFTKNGIENAKALLKNDTRYVAKITEFVLGFDEDVHPGEYNTDKNFTGYSHTDLLIGTRLSEAKVLCSDSNTCTHASYIAVKNFLENYNHEGPVFSGKIFTNSLGMTFNQIPAGTFMMGSPEGELGRNDWEESQRKVTLTQAFYMQTTEVTQGQWQELMGNNPSWISYCGSDCPVENVSWNDIQGFIEILNTRGEGTYILPTEAQWEYSARAGTTTAFASGDITELYCDYDPNLDLMGWYCGNVVEMHSPVAQKEPNAWGLYDMHGNVWEWCQDLYGSYADISLFDPVGSSTGSYRVIRGGGWRNIALHCRSAYRHSLAPDIRDFVTGFRLILYPGKH